MCTGAGQMTVSVPPNWGSLLSGRWYYWWSASGCLPAEYVVDFILQDERSFYEDEHVLGTWCPPYGGVSDDVMDVIQSDAGVCRAAAGGAPLFRRWWRADGYD
ncbi:hypothetical protein QML58_20185 [Providencia rettgeri]|nr:hypothetical protein [Providencia rettgeri]